MASEANFKPTEFVADQAEDQLIKQPRYVAYKEALDSSLLEFESSREWADLITALQKVSKVFENRKFSQFAFIPRSAIITVTKRLAQCLHPALPGGVHLKALQLYDAIFRRIGPELLIRDLSLYSAGLFPLFQYASTRVKPVLLDMYVSYYLPLGPRLVPALSGLLMALLPGLEEESSELYPRVLSILHNIREVTNTEVFMLCMWRCLLFCPHCRLATVNYLSVTVPKNKALIVKFLPKQPLIAIQALIATLHDANVLAQRKALELIISHFPIQPANCVFTKPQLILLASGALDVVLRQDLSLTRRLYTWLLGAKEDSHLSEHSLRLLVATIRHMLCSDAAQEGMGEMKLVNEGWGGVARDEMAVTEHKQSEGEEADEADEAERKEPREDDGWDDGADQEQMGKVKRW